MLVLLSFNFDQNLTGKSSFSSYYLKLSLPMFLDHFLLLYPNLLR